MLEVAHGVTSPCIPEMNWLRHLRASQDDDFSIQGRSIPTVLAYHEYFCCSGLELFVFSGDGETFNSFVIHRIYFTVEME